MSDEPEPDGPGSRDDAPARRRSRASHVRRLLDAVRRRPLASGLALAGLVEAITCFNRFALGLRAKDHMDLLTLPTLGLRIHHGYVGLALLVLWTACGAPRRASDCWWRSWLLAGGIALALSDAVHHFIVLRLAVGSTEFP